MKNVPEALVGVDIVTGSEVLKHHAVLVKDGLIVAVISEAEVPEEYRRRELEPGYLTAGLVDIHTHGAGGWGFHEPEPDAHREALEVHLKAGVTTVVPTMSTAPMDDLIASLEAVDLMMRGGADLPRVPGAHLEGPCFSLAQRGAQDSNSLRSPNDGSIDRLLDYSEIITMMSFAPELPGAVGLTQTLVAKGIVAAAGHSDARDEELWACQREGLSHVIHIFSGQSTTIRNGPWRQPGMLEATLASDDLTVEMIGDGKHLPDTLMKLAMRCLAGRLCLVSDSTPGAGLPDGSVYGIGDRDFMVENGVGVTMDRLSFAGSTTLISQMLPRVSQLGMKLPELVAMVTSIPAQAVRLKDVGRIASGYRADFALFDRTLAFRASALANNW